MRTEFYFPRCFLMAVVLLNAVCTTAQLKPKVPAITYKDNKQPVKLTVATEIKNNIKLNSKTLSVSKAYLLFDDGSSVPATNKIALNQRVNMILVIKSGWSEREGRVFPGGREIIKLSDGKVVLDSDDVFKTYESSGVSSDNAAYITLKAVITKMDDKKKYVIVNFRVWDKKGVGEVTGSYKLYIE
ncbi:MAG: hypothetical protein ABJA78_04860 [Ferruginibacter sp.]